VRPVIHQAVLRRHARERRVRRHRDGKPVGVRGEGGIWLRGGIAVTAADGTPYPVRNRVVLCRCGASSNKPFCDGSHATIGFADAVLETVDAEPDGTDSVTTPGAATRAERVGPHACRHTQEFRFH